MVVVVVVVQHPQLVTACAYTYITPQETTAVAMGKKSRHRARRAVSDRRVVPRELQNADRHCIDLNSHTRAHTHAAHYWLIIIVRPETGRRSRLCVVLLSRGDHTRAVSSNRARARDDDQRRRLRGRYEYFVCVYISYRRKRREKKQGRSFFIHISVDLCLYVFFLGIHTYAPWYYYQFFF